MNKEGARRYDGLNLEHTGCVRRASIFGKLQQRIMQPSIPSIATTRNKKTSSHTILNRSPSNALPCLALPCLAPTFLIFCN